MHLILHVVSTQIKLQDFLSGIRKKGIKVGFIPTMGALHKGHIDLVKKSVEENDYTVVSVYVNQLQFNNPMDFENYPVNHDSDLNLLRETGCDVAFFPETSEIYPKDYKPIKLELGILEQVLEGPLRPGHYNGVVQVVYRLFQYVEPDKAYFGLKDFQQCLVIKVLRDNYFPGIALEFCPTTRLENGLAMSSRNERLSLEGKEKATTLYTVLQTVEKLSKHIEVADALNYGKFLLTENDIETEYLELVNADSMIPGKKWFKKGKNVVLIAAYIEGVRLIDNIIF